MDPAIMRKARTAFKLAASKPHIALQKIQDLCDEHIGIALLFQTQAQILEKCYDEATDLDKGSMLMENAIQCARNAITLSPNSMDFNTFLGYLYYKRSVNSNDCKKAIQQFNTALNIPRPSDPAQETLFTNEKMQSYEARIEVARKCILKHIGDCLSKLKDLKAYSSIKQCLQIVKVNTNEERLHVAWYSLSLFAKLRLFEVSVVDLTSRLISSKNHYDVFSQALSFYEFNRKWRFWMCCTCNQKFPTCASYLNHVLKTHLRELLTEFRNVFSLRLIDWVTFIEKIKWKPLDTLAVITTLEKKRQTLPSTPESSSSAGEVQSLEKPPHEKLLEERSLFNQESLLSDDSNRATLLSKIRDELEDFVCSDWFRAFHLDMIIQRAMKLLHGFLGNCLTELDSEHYCLCLLDASQLEGILKFLGEMFDFTSKSLGKESSNEDILGFRTLGTEIEGEISLNSDVLYVSLDECSLTSGNLSKKGNNKHCSPIPDDWISWICSGPSSDQHLKEWRNLEDQKISHGKKELVKFENCLSESLKNLHEFQEELAVDVTPTDVSAPEVDKEMLAVDATPTDVSVLEVEEEIGFSSQKPEEDNSIQSMIHEKRENNDSVLSKSERRILEVVVDIQKLETILSSVAAYNYQPIMLSIVKSYIRERLERTVRNIAIKEDAAATGAEEVGRSLKMKEPNDKLPLSVDNQESDCGQTTMTRKSCSLKMKEPFVDNQDIDWGHTLMPRESFIDKWFDHDDVFRTTQGNLVNQQVRLGDTEATRRRAYDGFDPAEIQKALLLSLVDADQHLESCSTQNPEDDKQDMIDTLDKHGITIGVQSVDEVKAAKMRIQTSLPLKPGSEVIEAAKLQSKIIAKRDRLLEVILNEERPQQIPEKKFKSLKEKQRNFLLYLISEEERRTAQLLELERIHVQMEDPGSGSSSEAGSDAEDVKRGHFAVIAMDAGKPKRYVISVDYLNHPAIRELLVQAEEEYGFAHKGALTLPCSAAELDAILREQWKP